MENLINGRQLVEKVFYELVNSIQHLVGIDTNIILNTRQTLNNINNTQCYQKFVQTIDKKCFNINRVIHY